MMALLDQEFEQEEMFEEVEDDIDFIANEGMWPINCES
jgi:hypothetical protein